MASPGMLRRVALVRTDVSEELSASIISMRRLLVTANAVPSSPILVPLIREAIITSETSVLTRAHDVTSQKTQFFIITAVKISNLTRQETICKVCKQ
jgi:hypothetical protein